MCFINKDFKYNIFLVIYVIFMILYERQGNSNYIRFSYYKCENNEQLSMCLPFSI